MSTNEETRKPRKEFRECFAQALGMPTRWFGHEECVWLDRERAMHGLYLHHYGGTICPPVWRAQINHITPRPIWRAQKSVKIGDTVWHLTPRYSWDDEEDPLLISHQQARTQFAFELSFHLDELEIIAAWLGKLLTARDAGASMLPPPPVSFTWGQRDVLGTIFSHSGYLWTEKANVDYDIGVARENAREVLRSKRREKRKRWLEQQSGSAAGMATR